jgi:hypothetical protein
LTLKSIEQTPNVKTLEWKKNAFDRTNPKLLHNLKMVDEVVGAWQGCKEVLTSCI